MSGTLARGSERETVAILVGGLRSRDAWGGIESDGLLRDLNLRFYRYQYGYQSVLFSAIRLSDMARDLDHFVRHHVPCEAELILVGHSLGGMILQQLLTGSGQDFLNRVRLVVLVATPVSSKPLVLRLLSMLPFLKSLFLPAREIDSLNEKWNVLRKERGIRVVSVVGLSDRVAPYDGGRHWDARNVIVVDRDHAGLAQAKDIVSRILYENLRGRRDSSAPVTD